MTTQPPRHNNDAAILPPERVPGDVLAWSETRLPLAADGQPALALWRPKHTAVAIGVGQSAETDVIPEALRADGAELIRRPSGGGAVVLCPGVLCWEAWKAPAESIRALYSALSAPVLLGLRSLGVDAFQAGVCDIAATAGTPAETAQTPAKTAEALPPRKLAGTAQLRRRKQALVHGSLLVNAELSLLSRYLPQPAVAPEYRAGRGHDAFCINVSSLLPHIRADELMPAVAAAVTCAARSLGWEILAPPEKLPPEVEKLAREKYRSPDWNWKKRRSTAS